MMNMMIFVIQNDDDNDDEQVYARATEFTLSK